MFPSVYFKRTYFDVLFFPGEDTAPPDIAGAEYRVPAGRTHYTATGDRPHYKATGTRTHYTAKEERE